MEMNMQETIVLYPSPDMGHIVSMVELGKKILHHCNNHNISISISIILITGPFDAPSTISYINLISQTHPSISFHRLPPLPLDVPSPTWSPAAIAFHHFRQNAPNVAHSLRQISKSCSVRAFVIDLFCTSALHIAKDLGLPTYYFYTSGAAALAAFLFLPTIHQQITKSFKDLPDTVLPFPGLPPIKATHMPEPCLDREDPAYDDMLYFCSHLAKSDGIVVNTFEELEPKAVKTIASGVCVPGSPMPPVYYIGPLIADGDDRGDMELSCLSWLETQPKRSVVFLCFGSRGSFSKAQVKEIARGLETSGQRFLWVVKNPPADEVSKQTREVIDFDLESVLPEGFLERTKERGLVVKNWAPQVAVLRREAVGGFVTHCGWNSVLEAVVAGVPMVAWPLYAEQHLNREFLVEAMEMAIPVEQREEDGFVTGDELGKRVRELMSSEKGLELRQRSEKMKDKAFEALGESGSSTGALAKLIQAWKER